MHPSCKGTYEFEFWTAEAEFFNVRHFSKYKTAIQRRVGIQEHEKHWTDLINSCGPPYWEDLYSSISEWRSFGDIYKYTFQK